MKFLVPYDFSPITETALDYAIQLTTHVPVEEIEVLHIVGKEGEIGKAEQRLSEVKAALPASAQGIVKAKVRVGDIFTDIGREAEEGDAQLLVMGTHGAKGLQKIFGSHAIKVITSSNTPFIVTQSKKPGPDINRIVLPVDLTKESIQITRFAKDVAKRFDSEVHLIHDTESDEWLANKVRNNVNMVKAELKKEGIKHEVHQLDGKEAFHKEVIDYCAKFRGDLIAVTHFSDSILPQFDKFSQEIITNHLEVPVLIVNGRNISNVNTNFTFMSM